MKVWLDDVRPAPEGWVHLRNYSQFVEFLSTNDVGSVTEMSLDHDLGEGCARCMPVDPVTGDVIILEVCDHRPRCGCACHMNGQDCVQWMMDHGKLPPGRPYVHSANYYGRLRMEGLLRDAFELRMRCSGSSR